MWSLRLLASFSHSLLILSASDIDPVSVTPVDPQVVMLGDKVEWQCKTKASGPHTVQWKKVCCITSSTSFPITCPFYGKKHVFLRMHFVLFFLITSQNLLFVRAFPDKSWIGIQSFWVVAYLDICFSSSQVFLNSFQCFSSDNLSVWHWSNFVCSCPSTLEPSGLQLGLPLKTVVAPLHWLYCVMASCNSWTVDSGVCSVWSSRKRKQ